jgi:membrane associated rhomboid family serine protease
MSWYGQFVKRFGFAGFLLTVQVVCFAALIILYGTLGQEKFGLLWAKISLPANLNTAIDQPWSLLTYWLANHPLSFWFLLTDLVVLYAFGHILNAMIGDRRLQGVVIIAILMNGLVAIGLGNLLPTVELTPMTRLFGFGAVNATIVTAAITLVPRYNFRLFMWDVPLLFVGLFILAISLISHRLIFTLEGVAELVGIAVGFGLIKTMRNGWDLTNWFHGAANRPAQPLPRHPEPVLSQQRPVVVRAINPKQQPAPNQPPVLSEAEELDDLLDKINEVGYDRLSKYEKERLDKLSGK